MLTNNTEMIMALTSMVRHNGSDMFYTSDKPICLRVSGNVVELGEDVLDAKIIHKRIESILTSEQLAEFEEVKEMNISLYLKDIGRFRVNVFQQMGCPGMVIRHIPLGVPTLDELNMPDIFKDIIMSKLGLILMVGATGSGKSTTLAAMINHRNVNSSGHIVTLEDPVEFVHKHKGCLITQREIGTDTLTFQSGLKNVLRQNPNVILLGEVRDKETMKHALELSQSGHLCLATLHANGSPQSIERILKWFPEEEKESMLDGLALNLKGIISQRLVKTVDNKITPTIEILLNTPRVADLISQNDISSLHPTMEEGEKYGMQTFDQDLCNLWLAGKIDKDVALLNSNSPNNLRINIERKEKKNGINSSEVDELELSS